MLHFLSCHFSDFTSYQIQHCILNKLEIECIDWYFSVYVNKRRQVEYGFSIFMFCNSSKYKKFLFRILVSLN